MLEQSVASSVTRKAVSLSLAALKARRSYHAMRAMVMRGDVAGWLDEKKAHSRWTLSKLSSSARAHRRTSRESHVRVSSFHPDRDADPERVRA